MRNRMIVLAAVALTACANEPVSKAETNNPSVSVDMLVTIEGCHVYRFYDTGRYHYTTICPDGRSARVSSAWSEQQGKTVVTEYEELDTVRKPR